MSFDRAAWKRQWRVKQIASLRVDPLALEEFIEARREDNRASRLRRLHNNPRLNLRDRLRVAYKMSLEMFDEMVITQSGRCAACNDPCVYLEVDHDHNCCPGEITCGKCIRGLLCRSCNVMLGVVNDCCKRLEAGITYLKGQQS